MAFPLLIERLSISPNSSMILNIARPFLLPISQSRRSLGCCHQRSCSPQRWLCSGMALYVSPHWNLRTAATSATPTMGTTLPGLHTPLPCSSPSPTTTKTPIVRRRGATKLGHRPSCPITQSAPHPRARAAAQASLAGRQAREYKSFPWLGPCAAATLTSVSQSVNHRREEALEIGRCRAACAQVQTPEIYLTPPAPWIRGLSLSSLLIYTPKLFLNQAHQPCPRQFLHTPRARASHHVRQLGPR